MGVTRVGGACVFLCLNVCVCGGGDAPFACPLPSIRICVRVRLYLCMCALGGECFCVSEGRGGEGR